MKAQVPLNEFGRNGANDEPYRPVKKQERVFRLENALAFSEVGDQRTQSCEDSAIAYEGNTVGDEVVEGILGFVGLGHFFLEYNNEFKFSVWQLSKWVVFIV